MERQLNKGDAQLNKRIWFVVFTIVVLFLSFYIVTKTVKDTLNAEYEYAVNQIKTSEFESAIYTFDILGKSYKQSEEFITYSEGRMAYDAEKYDEAIQKFESLHDFMDSEEYASKAKKAKQEIENERMYDKACKFLVEQNYAKAYTTFNNLKDYGDSKKLAELSIHNWRLQCAEVISAGIRCSVGIMEDGNVKLSSNDYFYGRDAIEHQWSDVISVSACGEFVMGLRNDGKVLLAKMEKDDRYTYAIDTTDWNDVVDISAGQKFVAALKSDGTVYSAGEGGFGKAEIDEWKNIVAIDTGWQHIVGLDQEGIVHVAGYRSTDLLNKIAAQQDEWHDIVSIATGGSLGSDANGVRHKGTGHIIALRNDGKILAVGDNEFGQCEVEQWSSEGIASISAGDYHTIALTGDGTLLSTQREEDAPDSYKKVNGEWKEEKFVAISGGYGFTLAVNSDGEVKHAGFDGEGQANICKSKIIISR